MRALLLTLAALVFAVPAASAKGGASVLVFGPRPAQFVEPPAVFDRLARLRLELVAPPREPYVLVAPLLASGVAARPGRWYPRSGTYCSGWRSGVEAGCALEPWFRGWLGSGRVTGLFSAEPVRMLRLLRGETPLLAAGKEAWTIATALRQRGVAMPQPAHCVPFTATWTSPGWPASFCVGRAGNVYADGKLYPLRTRAASFVTG